jgi:hypothetical protein
MARKIAGGIAGQPSVAGVQFTTLASTTLTAADNADITIDPSGTGIFKIGADAQINDAGVLRFADADSSNYVGFKSPATVTANVTWTLPATDGTSGQFLSTNSSGTLSWASGGVAVSDQTSSSSTHYLYLGLTTSGTATTINVSTTKLTFQPSTGTLTTTILTESSSAVLKENFDPIENALEKIMELTGWIYDRKDGSQIREPGLVAEQVYPVIPNVVTLDANGNPAGINYSRFSAYLIEAVKSLKQEINELKGTK